MSNNNVNIQNAISVLPSSATKIHDLTMLYLKSQNISNLTISELAQKYTDIAKEFKDAFRNQN